MQMQHLQEQQADRQQVKQTGLKRLSKVQEAYEALVVKYKEFTQPTENDNEFDKQEAWLAESQDAFMSLEINNDDNNLFSHYNLHFNILTGPQVASASLGKPVHQNIIIRRVSVETKCLNLARILIVLLIFSEITSIWCFHLRLQSIRIPRNLTKSLRSKEQNPLTLL